MSSSSACSRCGSGFRYRRLVGCDCKDPKPPMERVSWSDSNPGRRFFNCVDSLIGDDTKKCDFFQWFDPELPNEHYLNWVNKIKNELKSFKDKSYCGKLIKKVAELEKMNQDLELQIVAEREANEGACVQAAEERAKLVKEMQVLNKKVQVAVGLLVFAVGVMLVWVVTNCIEDSGSDDVLYKDMIVKLLVNIIMEPVVALLAVIHTYSLIL
ncbi:hypothetical protein LXL04_006174 [Taraxacum kok-saghyz]